METVHSKTEPYAFDYFFEENQKRQAALRAKKNMQESDAHDRTDEDKGEDLLPSTS